MTLPRPLWRDFLDGHGVGYKADVCVTGCGKDKVWQMCYAGGETSDRIHDIRLEQSREEQRIETGSVCRTKEYIPSAAAGGAERRCPAAGGHCPGKDAAYPGVGTHPAPCAY